jgi:hypothetical protein
MHQPRGVPVTRRQCASTARAATSSGSESREQTYSSRTQARSAVRIRPRHGMSGELPRVVASQRLSCPNGGAGAALA